ncbi:MAG: formimidoylglutamase [Phycisphaerales bacterium]|jgi:formimidoylglutamase|nr:formimidoylglutamase [Phycisphaerales bacterium]
MVLPHCSPPGWPHIAEGRFARSIQTDRHEGCRVALLGVPDDLGVRLNRGRPGAREGPTALRRALASYGTLTPHGFDWPGVFDAGDVQPAPGEDEDALHETHDRVEEAARALHALGLTVIGIGGGHDLTLPLARAAARARQARLGVVYLDAHLDVREAAGSGMPFRALVEQGHVRELRVHGLRDEANAREHIEWFLSKGGVIDRDEDVDRWPHGDVYASLDLDAIDAAHAPGVSALNPAGLTPREAERWARQAGRHQGVRGFDLMELNPWHDEQGRTARVAAMLLLAFLRGVSEREA